MANSCLCLFLVAIVPSDILVHILTWMLVELAEALQGLFSRKWPGNASCDAFLHFNSLIKLSPREIGALPQAPLYLLPQEPLVLEGGRRWSHCLCGSSPRQWSSQMNICFLLLYIPPLNDSHLSFLKHYLVGGALCKQAVFKWSSIKFFSPQGISVSSSLCGENFYLGLQKVLSHSVTALWCFQHQLLALFCLWSTFWSHWWMV